MEFWQGVLMVSSQSSVAGLAAMESGRRGSREVVGLIPAMAVVGVVAVIGGCGTPAGQ